MHIKGENSNSIPKWKSDGYSKVGTTYRHQLNSAAPAHFRPEFDPKYQTAKNQINSMKIPLLKVVNALKSK